jgi:exopolyphosphatase/guanosine-5'-triphosphate,3'-diphosphate pyrophosphatase
MTTRPPRKRRVPAVLAAVDLGSNSFHMVVARQTHGQLVIIDRLREMVRLAAGLTTSGALDATAQARALACLSRFGQRLHKFHARGVRVVGTNTLRKAKHASQFLLRAEAALGHPIEIISGIEEARLIHLGVTRTLPKVEGRRLIVDIGGGSTECIVARGLKPLALESLYMGCVATATAHFPGGRVTRKRFAAALVACQVELEPIAARYRALGWQEAVGSSGSVRAVAEAIRELAPTGGRAGTITRAGLDRLIEHLCVTGNLRVAGLSSITAERAPVFLGGLAILTALFDAFHLQRLQVAEGALREGLLHDMLGRLSDGDARERTVRSMSVRFNTDAAQGERVAQTADRLLRKVAVAWRLDPLEHGRWLRWAAALHEIGMDIAHTGYHKHGAYLLEHADMPGFTREEQQVLACLVGSHRRKVAELRLAELAPALRRKVSRLVVILRLAVVLHRSRAAGSAPPIALEATETRLTLRFPRGWLKRQPLTAADLEQERDFLESVPLRLQVR